jgi:two-component system response regulator DevR
MNPISLLIADDHAMVRMGLRSLLDTCPGITVVGEADSLEGLSARVEEMQPTVLLLDVKFPTGDSFSSCEALKRKHPELRVLFLTSHGTDEVVFQCIRCGADGFLLKDVAPEVLTQAVLDVAAGKSILDPSVTAKVFTHLKTESSEGAAGAAPETHQERAPAAPHDLVDSLSPQELNVLEKVAEGLTNKEIAEEIGLSPKTVKNYLSNAMGKLGFNRRAQAAAFYVKHYRERF